MFIFVMMYYTCLFLRVYATQMGKIVLINLSLILLIIQYKLMAKNMRAHVQTYLVDTDICYHRILIHIIVWLVYGTLGNYDQNHMLHYPKVEIDNNK